MTVNWCKTDLRVGDPGATKHDPSAIQGRTNHVSEVDRSQDPCCILAIVFLSCPSRLVGTGGQQVGFVVVRRDGDLGEKKNATIVLNGVLNDLAITSNSFVLFSCDPFGGSRVRQNERCHTCVFAQESTESSCSREAMFSGGYPSCQEGGPPEVYHFRIELDSKEMENSGRSA